jgi:hypothetical protein
VALLERFRVRLSPQLKFRSEVPVVELATPGTIDLRAWDAAVDGPGWTLRVEAETRVHDMQALERRIALKQRDGSIDCVLLVLSDTRHHREFVELGGEMLRATFPIPARIALRALSRAKPPPGNALILL